MQLRLILLVSAFVIATFSQTADQQSGAITDPSIIAAILREHNKVRTQGQPPLVWNPALADIAAPVAGRGGSTCGLSHSGGRCGENLAQDNIRVGKETLVDALVRGVQMWNDEATGACSGGGHYTQVIWSSTTEVGCGFYKCSGTTFQKVVLACSYNPAGNFNRLNPCQGQSPSPCTALISGGSSSGGTTPKPVAPSTSGSTPRPSTSGSTPPSTPSDSDCSDLSSPNFRFNGQPAPCNIVKKQGWCSQIPHSYCKITCGFDGCSGAAPSTSGPSTSGPSTSGSVVPTPRPVFVPTPVPRPIAPSGGSGGANDDQQSGPVTDQAIINAILAEHNKVRTQGQPPLKWNPALANIAAPVAGRGGSTCGLSHSGGRCGENLAQDNIRVGKETLIDALVRGVKMWNDEATGACSGGGHYTQVIWSSTTEVGCGFYKCSGTTFQKVVLACSYNPAGNFNRLNPCQGKSPSACTPLLSSANTGDSAQEGADGTPGTNGFDGADGADGADGFDGADGADGADGTPGGVSTEAAPEVTNTDNNTSESTPGWAIALLVIGCVVFTLLVATIVLVLRR